ncbi:mitochondrial matrix Mmp37 [Kalaharituber pfeilii]|nr:mitochondrial matrix Mmp37 [Kalaharituber pfeilii]
MIDLIFGVTYTQHWHSINLTQNPHHYSFLRLLGSRVVSRVQDDWGAGVYFNPFVEINGTLIKYGVVKIETLLRDLSTWDTLYLAGRLHKPVKILRDDPRVRYANQLNLLAAVRTALLLLPETFTEEQLYATIASLSYTGDPRMHLFTENPNKVSNIVANQLPNFRRLYSPLIDVLPNINYVSSCSEGAPPQDTWLVQDMSLVPRANMLRRLPGGLRDKVYFAYQARYKIPGGEFQRLVGVRDDEERLARRTAGDWERRIMKDDDAERVKMRKRGTEGVGADGAGIAEGGLGMEVRKAIRKTVMEASVGQSLKGVLTAGPGRSWRYLGEKVGKWRDAKSG